MQASRDKMMDRRPNQWEMAQTVEECEQVIRKNVAALCEWRNSHKPLVVMCPPHYFSVDTGSVGGEEVAGNAFVKAGFKAFERDPEENRRRIMQEWQTFRDTIKACGADILEMTPNPQFPDQVFTADHSFSCVYLECQKGQLVERGSKTIISQLAHPNRMVEVNEVIRFFEAISENKHYPEIFSQRQVSKAKGKFEGIGDNLLDPYRGIVLSGYGFRNSKENLPQFQEMIGIPVYSFENKKPFFHIDTYCAILPGGMVLYAPEVMHEKTQHDLDLVLFKGHAELKDKYLISASKEDAYTFACNALTIGDRIIMQPCSDSLKQALRSKGLKVEFVPATVANYAGGGLHCMSNIINQPVFI